MRKLSGIFAGTLALTLVFGMTTFAAPSKSTTDQDSTPTSKELTSDELEKQGYTPEKLAADGVQKEAVIIDVYPAATTNVFLTAPQDSKTATTSETVEFDEKAANDSMSAGDKAAAEKKAAELSKNVNAAGSSALLSNGLVVNVAVKPVSAAVADNLDEVKWKLAEIVSPDGKDAKDVAVKGAADVTIPGVTKEALAKGVSITIDFGFTVDPKKNYILLHLVDGVWKTEKITILSTNGKVTTVVNSLSPFAVSEYALVETPDDDDDDDAAGSGAAGSSTINSKGKAASPKTGEAMPFAGVAAAVALAGAAVAAKKVRYNG